MRYKKQYRTKQLRMMPTSKRKASNIPNKHVNKVQYVDTDTHYIFNHPEYSDYAMICSGFLVAYLWLILLSIFVVIVAIF